MTAASTEPGRPSCARLRSDDRLALRGLLGRRVSTGLAAAGLVTAVTGFLVLAGVSRTTQATLSGDIAAAWDTPYDILVRPTDSETELERAEGLVRPNFLSGVTGGITRAQVDAIRSLPNVEVAAPIAVVGFVEWPASFPVEMAADPESTGGGMTVFRITAQATGEAGLSRYPALPATYLVVASRGEVIEERASDGSIKTYLEVDGSRIECALPIACYGGLTPDVETAGALGAGIPGVSIAWDVPIIVAGIDPAAEAELADLDECMTDGRYLGPSDQPATVQSQVGPQPTIPVIVSERSFVDQRIRLTIDRADNPSAILAGELPQDLDSWTPSIERVAAADDAYASYLQEFGESAYYDASPHWAPGPVAYRRVGDDHLAAELQPPTPQVYESQVTVGGGAQRLSLAPVEASDVWFRSIRRYDQVMRGELFSRWDPVGRYDPLCLPGFDPLAGGRLEAYAPPDVRLADGRTLGPTRSLASYVNSPPLVLTTLDGAEWLTDPVRFEGAAGQAFISAVRIRVEGVGDPGPVAETRLAAVAGAIHDATGLQVDIVKGSSPRTVRVDLPAGAYGRPALTVNEGWSVKGVAVVFIQAVSGQDLAIFVIVLLGAMLLVADTAYVAVRQREAELATLRAIGWSSRRVAWLIELELLVLGAGVGIVAMLVTLALVPLGFDPAPWHITGAIPLALVVAAIAGLPPALLVYRGHPVRPLMGIERSRHSRHIRSLSWLAIADLIGSRRVDLTLGGCAVALGSALVGGVALVGLGFEGHLDTTVLGVYLAATVRPFHVAIAILTLVVSALACGEIVSLGYLRRETAFATFRAVGWPRRYIARFLAVQALTIGLVGGTVGAIATFAAAHALAATPGPAQAAMAAAIVAAVAASLLSAVGPIMLIARASPAVLLRSE